MCDQHGHVEHPRVFRDLLVIIVLALFIAGMAEYATAKRQCVAITAEECISSRYPLIARILVYHQAAVPPASALVRSAVDLQIDEFLKGRKREPDCAGVVPTDRRGHCAR